MTGSVRAKAATSQAVPEPHPVDSRDISEHNKRQYDEIYWRYGYYSFICSKSRGDAHCASFRPFAHG